MLVNFNIHGTQVVENIQCPCSDGPVRLCPCPCCKVTVPVCLLKDGSSDFLKDESVEVSQTEYHHP